MNEESKSCRSAERFYTAALLSTSPDPLETIEMQNGVPFGRFFSQPPYGRMASASMPKKLAQRCFVSHVASHAGHVETTNFMLKGTLNSHK